MLLQNYFYTSKTSDMATDDCVSPSEFCRGHSQFQKSPAITPTKWHTFLTCLRPEGSTVCRSFEMTPELRCNKSWTQRDQVQVDIPRFPHHRHSDSFRHRTVHQEKRATKIYILCTFLTCLKPKGSTVCKSFEMTPELRCNKSWTQRDPVQVDIPRFPHHRQSDSFRHQTGHQEKRVTKICIVCQDGIARKIMIPKTPWNYSMPKSQVFLLSAAHVVENMILKCNKRYANPEL
jgi:hypothetical protein